MTKILIDALGADEGPAMILDAIIQANKEKDFEAVVFGPKYILSELEQYPNIEIVDTEEYIRNEESPVMAIRKKKQSSTVLGLNRLNEDGDVFLSAGSTGALLAGGYFITKRLNGIERACLAVTIPNPYGGTVLLDSGANMDTTPEILKQFAILGTAYVEASLHRTNPRIGLLNVGVEVGKGDKRSIETFDLLSVEDSPLNFVGNVEARSLLDDTCDVIVADGFAGNIALKTLEGTAKTLLNAMKEGLLSSLKAKIGALLIKDTLKEILGQYNYKDHGGAPLLGVKRPIYKAHGNSSAETFKLAILEAIDYAEDHVENKIDQIVQKNVEFLVSK